MTGHAVSGCGISSDVNAETGYCKKENEKGKRNRKGTVLTGGSGNRANPLTKVTSKQLPPIYEKPIIYCPVSVRMQAGIRDILITPPGYPRFRELLGDGHQLGVRFSYAVQPSPDGLTQVFIIGADFIGDDCAAEVPPARAVLWSRAPL